MRSPRKSPSVTETRLRHLAPARNFTAGLRIGTGRLAAMVPGDPVTERLALNHEWLWRGRNRDRDTRPRSHLLPEVRQQLLEGRWAEGTVRGNRGLRQYHRRPRRADPHRSVSTWRGPVHSALPRRGYRLSARARPGDWRCSRRVPGRRGALQEGVLAHLPADLLLVRLTATPFSGRSPPGRAAIAWSSKRRPTGAMS